MDINTNINIFEHIHNSKTPVFFLEQDRIIFANQAFATLSGHKAEDLQNAPAFLVFSKEDFDSLKLNFDFENQESAKELNLKLLTKTLDLKIINVSWFCLNKENGKYLFFCRDITVSSVSQRKMVKAKTYVDSIFTNLQDGVIVLDNDAKVMNINNGALHYGLSTVKTIVNKITKDYDLLSDDWEDVNNKKVEFTDYKKDTVYLTANIKKYLAENIHAVFIINFTDITDHVLLEKEIQRQKNELQKQYDKMDKELVFAKSIQENIVPSKICQIADLSIGTKFYIANRMGGDYFEILSQNDNTSLFGIFDVSGHGVAASLIVMMLKAMLSTIHSSQVEDSKEVFYYLQENFNNKIPGKHFVAAVFCRYEESSGKLNFTCGGNYLPLHINGKTGEITEPGQRGFPIGFIRNPSFDSTTIDFALYDKLVMFTDGIVEAKNKNDEYFSHERVVELVKKYYKYSSFFLQRILYKELIEYIEGEENQGDDVTIMVVSKESPALLSTNFEFGEYLDNLEKVINKNIIKRVMAESKPIFEFLRNDTRLDVAKTKLEIHEELFTTSIRISNLFSRNLNDFLSKLENPDFYYNIDSGYLYLEFRDL